MTTTNNANSVNTLVASFQVAFQANLDKQREFQVRGLRSLWTQIAEAFAVAQTILKPENKKDYDAALVERSIEPAKSKGNPYTPVVKLLYGEWKDEQHTLFAPNRSAEKYACVFRYLNKRRGKIAQADIVGHIEGYTHAIYGNHLKGIEAEDRADHKPKGKSKADDSEALIIGSTTEDGIAVDRPGFVPEDVSMGQLWFKTGKDGKVYILGYRKIEEDTFNTLAIKRGKDILEKDAERLKQDRLSRQAA